MRCRWRWLYRQVQLVLLHYSQTKSNLTFPSYSQDLVSALQELGLEGAINVSDLMQQMGADTHGKVSYEQFLQCRLSHRTEIEALRVHGTETSLPHSSGWINANDLCGNIGR